jgi:hypothetical protein
MKSKRKQSRLGEVNFLGKPIQPAFNHKHSQPIFGFKPFKPSKPQPIKGYPGINMFSSIAIPQRQSTSMWTPHSRPGRAMWGDKDGDGVYNGFDCQPNNRFKQGDGHKRPRKRAAEERIYRGYVVGSWPWSTKTKGEQKAREQIENENRKNIDKMLAEKADNEDRKDLHKRQMAIQTPEWKARHRVENRTEKGTLIHNAEDMIGPGIKKPQMDRGFQPIGFPREKEDKHLKWDKKEDDDDDYEYELQKRKDEEEREKFGLPADYMGGGGSSIMKRKGNKALIRHYDDASPASESPTTFEIRDDTGKSHWQSGITQMAEFVAEGGSPLKGDREYAEEQFEKMTKEEKAEKEFEEKNFDSVEFGEIPDEERDEK